MFVALIFTSVTPATAAGSPPPLSGLVVAAARQLQLDWRVPWPTAVARIERQPAEERLAATLAEEDSLIYAGSYVDNANDGRFVVMTTSPLDIAAAVGSSGLDPAMVLVRRARFSAVRLQSDAATIAKYFQAHRATLGPTWSFIDTARNTIVLSLPPNSPSTYTRQAFLQLLSTYPDVQITTGGNAFTSAVGTCDFWTCPPPLRGGVEDDWYNSAGQGFLCTLSFLGTDNTSGDPVALSAGHCETSPSNGPYVSPGPDDLFYGGATIGDMSRYQNGGNVDGEVIDLTTGGGTYSNTTSNYVYQRTNAGYQQADVNGTVENEELPIQYAALNSQIVDGVFVCKSGRTSGLSCGSINKTGVSGSACESNGTNCTNYTNFFGFTGCSAGGDSGAPIYQPSPADNPTSAVAVGLVSYVPTSQYSGCSSTSGETYGPMISNVLSALNVTINTTSGGLI